LALYGGRVRSNEVLGGIGGLGTEREWAQFYVDLEIDRVGSYGSRDLVLEHAKSLFKLVKVRHFVPIASDYLGTVLDVRRNATVLKEVEFPGVARKEVGQDDAKAV
jgi:hypothetical protein